MPSASPDRSSSFGQKSENLLMSQPSAIPAFTAYSTAVWLMTGSVPGIPVQTGQQREFWLPPNSALQVQKSFGLGQELRMDFQTNNRNI